MNAKFLHYLVSRPQARNHGLTLAEVLVGILVAGFFSLAALQAVVIGLAAQIDARRLSDASSWIQEDVEQVKVVAYDLCITRFALRKLSSAATSTQLNLTTLIPPNPPTITGDLGYSDSVYPPACASGTSVNDGFRIGDNVLVGNNSSYRVTGPGTTGLVTAGSSLNVANISGVNPTSGYVFARCRATERTGGFGRYLMDRMIAFAGLSDTIQPGDFSAVGTATRTLNNRTYFMRREATVRNAAPFEILELRYTVRRDNSSGNVIAQLSTEVVPNAFFRCP